MKKKGFILMGLTLLISPFAMSDVYFSDDFNTGGTAGALDRGWEFIENEFVTEVGSNFTIAPEWAPDESGAAQAPGSSTGFTNPPQADGTESDGGYLLSDSDAGSGSDDIGSLAEIWAISPSFSTVGASSVWLHSDTEIDVNNNGEALALLDVTVDGGTTWLPVWILVEPERVIDDFNNADVDTSAKIGGWPEIGSGSHTKTFAGIHGRWHIQLPDAAANQPSVRFRIGWYEPADAWYIAMDNIVVDNVPPPTGAEVILSEDFENGIPSTWSNTTGKTQLWDTRPLWNEEFDEPLKNINAVPVNIDFVKNMEFWDLEIDLDNPDPQFNPKGLTDGRWILMLAGQGYALYQEGPIAPEAGEPSESADLDTPTLDLGNATAVFLDFDSEVLVGDGGTRYNVQVSVDGGETFTQIFTYNEALMDYGEAAYYDHQYLEVPQAAGQSQVVFRFHAEGQDPAPGNDPLAGGNGDMSGFWVVDNVQVTANTGTAVPEWSVF